MFLVGTGLFAPADWYQETLELEKIDGGNREWTIQTHTDHTRYRTKANVDQHKHTHKKKKKKTGMKLGCREREVIPASFKQELYERERHERAVVMFENT